MLCASTRVDGYLVPDSYLGLRYHLRFIYNSQLPTIPLAMTPRPHISATPDHIEPSQTSLRHVVAACVALCSVTSLSIAHAESPATEQVVVSASRAEQSRFDAPAAIDSVRVDSFRATSPLVNLSELLGSVPGLQVRDRQNFAQDLQVSVRGFGTRSSFGVRGVRILVDGIPATMPDGQGQAATASLTAATRVDVLRGPMAQLYGNAAGGVVQIFTKNPPRGDQPMTANLTVGAGSDGQRQLGAALAGGSDTLGATVDVSHFQTDGYRDHSAAERTQFTGKVVARPSSATTITALLNYFDQPTAQDPLGLTRADFQKNPQQATAGATTFNTRKKIMQQQAGVVIEHQLSTNDNLNARLYAGTRQVFQTLAFSGADLKVGSSGGVVDLDRHYGGADLNWVHKTRVNALPLTWTIGIDIDRLLEQRRGYVNNFGTPGLKRRDETDTARNLDVYGQVDWNFAPQWRVTGGLRNSHVQLAADDHLVTAVSPSNSGAVTYQRTSPVAGLVFMATDQLNVYANLGRGFETPTLAESAYRANGTGPNLNLQPSTSVQAEIGAKYKRGANTFDVALFDARSKQEIVPTSVVNGRSIFQNVDSVRRRGIEAGWQQRWDKLTTRLAYTLLDARFQQPFKSGSSSTVAAGNRLPGAPQHSFTAELGYQFTDAWTAGMDLRAESKVFVNDTNSDVASGYAVANVHTGYALRLGSTNLFVFGRIDNVFDKQYAGSVIVNDSNGRFFEPAPGRRFFVGVRTAL